MRAVNFIKEVKQEVSKVKWPTFKEVGAATLFVIAVVGVSGLLFLLVDSAIYELVKFLLGVGR